MTDMTKQLAFVIQGVFYFTLLFTAPVICHAENYLYDDVGRLISVTYDDASSIVYVIDPSGNLLSQHINPPDTDTDGLADPIDPDDDNDGFEDGDDLFPLDDTKAGDHDNDGIDSLTDTDDDGDGFNDDIEITAGTDPLDDTDFPILADGDITLDGTVDISDVLLAMRVLVGFETLTPEQLAHGDVAPLAGGTTPAPDGAFTIGDFLVIQRKILGIISF